MIEGSRIPSTLQLFMDKIISPTIFLFSSLQILHALAHSSAKFS